MKIIGALVAVTGVCIFVYGYFIFETSVGVFGVGDYRRVHNIKLLQDRQNMVILSAIMMAVGTLLFFFSRKESSLPPQSAELLAPQPTDTEALNSAAATAPLSQNLSSPEYQVFLIEHYKIKKVDLLEKYLCGDQLFDTVEAALSHAHELKLNAAKQELLKEASIPRVISQGSIGSTGLWRFKEFSSGEVIAESSIGQSLRFPSMSQAKEYFDN